MVDLASWAAWRWAGPRAAFLGTASPAFAVRGLPRTPPAPPPIAGVADPDVAELTARAIASGGGVMRLPPAADLPSVAAVAAAHGPALVVCASHAVAARVVAVLRRQGHPVAALPRDWAAARAGGVTVVGSRAAAFAPAMGAASMIVLDAHDDALQEERAPTWHAAEVVAERARRARVPCLLVSPCPDLALLAQRRLFVPARSSERSGWPVVDLLDRRGEDPRTGLYSPKLVAAIRRAKRSILVLNRKGRARLLACGACREVVRCERCDAAVSSGGATLACARCGLERPAVCGSCGSTALKTLRVGVSRARDELEALLQVPVGEVTGATDAVPQTSVVIGTEAVLHRVEPVDLVGFLDFDQELLAPRYRAAEEALALLVRGARLVGGRSSGGRVVVQTRLPRHPALAAALFGDPARLAEHEGPTRALLQFPPAAALATVSGAAAAEYINRLGAAAGPGVDIAGPSGDRWLVRAGDHATLCDALARVARPAGRLRVEVDPRRL